MARRFETYLAGAVMLLLGILLMAYLLSVAAANQLPALFLVGVGCIVSVLAVFKAKLPARYEMSARTTLAYGILALLVGVLWLSLSIEPILAGYVLAFALVFFGLIFLAFTRLKSSSS